MRNWGYDHTSTLFGEPIIILALILLLAIGTAAALATYWAGHQAHRPLARPLDQRPAVQVLDRRYLQGEVTDDDYRHRRHILTQQQPRSTPAASHQHRDSP